MRISLSGSSDEGEIDGEVTTQSSEEEEEEDLMDEMTRGPLREPSESADDLTVRKVRDVSGRKEEEESLRSTGKDDWKISENSVSTSSTPDYSRTVEDCDGKKEAAENLSTNRAAVASGRFGFCRDDTDSLVRFRSAADHVDVARNLRTVPPELKVKEGGRGVWARENVPKGRRYGPFLGKWVLEPVDLQYAWEVSLHSFLSPFSFYQYCEI